MCLRTKRQYSAHCYPLDVLTNSSRSKERRNPRTTGPQPLSQSALGTKLNSNIPRQVLLLQSLVVAQIRKNQPVQLPIMRQRRQSTFARRSGIIRNCRERMQLIFPASTHRIDQCFCLLISKVLAFSENHATYPRHRKVRTRNSRSSSHSSHP